MSSLRSAAPPGATVVFASATTGAQVAALATALMGAHVTAVARTAPAHVEIADLVGLRLRHYRVEVERPEWRLEVLVDLLEAFPDRGVLVWCRSARSMLRLCDALAAADVAVAALHGGSSGDGGAAAAAAASRAAAIAGFHSGAVRVLVTGEEDAATRGLDLGGVPLMLHYELPDAADAYVRRVARAGAAHGRRGAVISIVTPGDAGVLRVLRGAYGVVMEELPVGAVAAVDAL